MKKSKYFLQLLEHRLATGVYYISKIGTCIPGISNFSKTIVASYVVGSSSQAIKEKRYDDAFKVLKTTENFELNDSYVGSAQYNLAYLYYYGYGVDKNISKAIELIKKAADKGDSSAIKYLNGGASNDPTFH